MRKILVTGGTGFIGRRLMRTLLARVGAGSLICFVNIAAGGGAELSAANEYAAAGVSIIEGDLSKSPVSSAPPPKVDTIFHLAANVDTSATEAASRVNDVGTERLLDWMDNRLANTRLMFTSSVAVSDRAAPARGPIDETSRCTPRTPYGESKRVAEEIIRARAATDGNTYTILRLPTVYGPGQRAEGLFEVLTSLISKGDVLGRVNWPGRTSIAYVDDVARILTDLSTLPKAANETFCVASDESLSVGEIAQRLGTAIGHPVDPIAIPPVFWRIVRQLAYAGAKARYLSGPFYLACWRLSLLADDGFWQTPRRLRTVYDQHMLRLDEGISAMMQEAIASPSIPAHSTGAKR